MNVLGTVRAGAIGNSLQTNNLEAAIHKQGDDIFTLMESAEAPSLFSKKGFYGTLMDWAMKDENFKGQLFRFVDVLPALASSAEVTRHLKEYLDNDEVNLNPALRTALKATSFAGGLLGGSRLADSKCPATGRKRADASICSTSSCLVSSRRTACAAGSRLLKWNSGRG